MIDWTQVADLRREVGEEDFEEVVDLFFEEVEEVTQRLAPSHPPSQLADDLHFLKGCALNMGFVAFSEACQQAEVPCANGAANQIDVEGILAVYVTSKTAFLADLPIAWRAA